MPSSPSPAPDARAAEALRRDTPYRGYAYAYPHKTAYRELAQPVALRDAWRDEDRGALLLYIHVPFCEMRCGFCNLFAVSQPPAEAVGRYLHALERQAAIVRGEIGPASYARFAVGGGTPSFLDCAGLERLFEIAAAMGVRPGDVPTSVEVSPATTTPEKVRLLRALGATRVSVGVQSFDERESRLAGRPQRPAELAAALDLLRDGGFDTLNVDLIYGLEGQTVESFLRSIRSALEYRPEELYLYPLYVRPLTGLGRTGRAWDDERLAGYRAGRDALLAAGYEQRSMRMFALPTAAETGPAYCCQDDGLVGLGSGARSYTRSLHYAGEYAVSRPGVRGLLDAYCALPDAAWAEARHGFALDESEQRRRYVIQTLLQADGLSVAAYGARFGSTLGDDLPELADLEACGLACNEGDRLLLTTEGLERSDAIGPWLYSPAVERLMSQFVPR